jgi:predicted dehydrogenase
MQIGFVGCGYVADMYVKSLKNYPSLELVAVTDSDQKRALEFGAYHSVNACPTVEALLAESNIEMIVNLSESTSHFKVSKACLEAGKHV